MQGAASYTGTEGSHLMATSAKLLLPEGTGTIYNETMESFQYPIRKFDLVTSRFAIHYVLDVHTFFQNVYKTLKDQGKFVFSIQHPLTTSSIVSKQTGDKRGNWIIHDYFLEGERMSIGLNRLL